MPCDFGSHETNAPDIEVAMFLGETQFTRKVFADGVAIEQGHGPAQLFQTANQSIGRR
jgi:hypothetical protein